jgi:hypothetical protein
MNETGIWNIEEAKVEHAFDKKLAIELTKILPKGEKVVDLGCGRGDYLSLLQFNGFDCIGYEGTPDIKSIASFPFIHQADLSKPIETEKGTVLCFEVAEHIPQEYEDVFLQNVVNASIGLVVISWAVKGQGGHGHVNEQDSVHIIDKFHDLGFWLNGGLTKHLRLMSSLWWFKSSIYVFEKI